MQINLKLLKNVDNFPSLYDERLKCFVKIANGQVKVFISGIDGTEVTLEILNKGELFGEMSLVDGEPCSASVKAVQKSDLLAISYLERSGSIAYNGKDLYVFKEPVLKI